MRRMEWTSFRVVCMLLATAAMIPCGPPPAAHGRTLAEIKASGEIHVCIAPVGPAFATPLDPQCRDDCSFFGPVYREVMAFMMYLGGHVRPVFHRVDWDEQFFDQTGETVREASYTPSLLASGRCDVYPSHLTKNEWRSRKLDFAILFSSRMMVIINPSLKGIIRTVTDLAGKTAAVEKNSSFHTWLMEQNQKSFANNPVTFRLMTLKEALNAVDAGEADFTLVDADIALWEAARAFRRLDVAFPVGPRDEIGWAFAKGDGDLRNEVQAFFDSQAPDGKSDLNRVWKEEFGVTLPQFQALIEATE